MNSVSAPSAQDRPLIRDGILPVSPPLAAAILKTMNYRRQRGIERGHVSALAVQMTQGQWLPRTPLAFARLPDGSHVLVNGQHRMHAIIESGTTQEFSVTVHPVADERGVAEVYYRYDTVERHRSKQMIVRAAGLAEDHEVRRTVARGAYEAAAILSCGLKRVSGYRLSPALKTPDGRLRAIEPYWSQVKLYNDLTAGAEKSLSPRLTIGSVMAVGLLTLRDQRAKAEPFWKGVADNSGLVKGDPRRALVSALMDRDLFAPGVAIALAANAWNAWYSGRRANYLKNMDVEPRLSGCRIP